jgi:hypothetical protein
MMLPKVKHLPITENRYLGTAPLQRPPPKLPGHPVAASTSMMSAFALGENINEIAATKNVVGSMLRIARNFMATPLMRKR